MRRNFRKTKPDNLIKVRKISPEPGKIYKTVKRLCLNVPVWETEAERKIPKNSVVLFIKVGKSLGNYSPYLCTIDTKNGLKSIGGYGKIREHHVLMGEEKLVLLLRDDSWGRVFKPVFKPFSPRNNP